MISTKLTLIAITVAVLTTTARAAPNYNGCAIINNAGECEECFERKLLLNGGGCGPALPKTDRCLLYRTGFEDKKIASVCSFCKPGYANRIRINGTKVFRSCVPATLKNCLLESDIVVAGKTDRSCVACPDNQYSVPNITTNTATCQKIAEPVANCKWGSLYGKGLGKPQCLRCNDGYAVDSVTRQCDKTVETGCWVQEKGKCIACNPFEGYSIDAKGVCFKTTTLAIY